MEKRKWLWKRKSSERSPGESDSSGSFSSHSERYSDEQEVSRESPNDGVQSPEVTSKKSLIDDEMKESVKCLTEKLSAALVNVSAKEDLVKQHAKVAEEAVAGWEKAENEVAALKQQLEAAVQQNVNLEVRASHVDGALKECVRQLRQARDEHEQRISDAIAEKSNEWKSEKAELEKQILELQAELEAESTKAENSASIDPNIILTVEALENKNMFLKQELLSRCKELEIIAVERDLSTQAAETASKLQLESIKKVTKLEAECRRLQSIARKSSPLNNQKSLSGSSFYAESLTDSLSDSGERLNTPDTETRKTGTLEGESDSWASALIAELDQFKNKSMPKNFAACSVEIDMMDDFLEMERLAALPETKIVTPRPASGSPSVESISMENQLRAELDSMIQNASELEKKLEKIQSEKLELETALDESQGSLKEAEAKMAEAKRKLEEMQNELAAVNKAKNSLEFQLIGMEVDTRTSSANVHSLKLEIEKERAFSSELKSKCQELENELSRTIQETAAQQNSIPNAELKLKQEDLAAAADKLAECQRTIASLGMQLKSLATLEDFLIDTSNIPGLSGGLMVSNNGGEMWKSPSNINVFVTGGDSDSSRIPMETSQPLENVNSDESPLSSQSEASASHMITAKSRNGFGKFFSRSKSVVELGDRQG